MPPSKDDKRFERLLTAPPSSTARLKSDLVRVRPRAKDLGPDHVATLTSIDGLLGHIAQKTTPFHVRLIHAVARLAVEEYDRQDPGPDLLTLRDTVNYVASRVRRPDLQLGAP